jgi:hypothetical protein
MRPKRLSCEVSDELYERFNTAFGEFGNKKIVLSYMTEIAVNLYESEEFGEKILDVFNSTNPKAFSEIIMIGLRTASKNGS